MVARRPWQSWSRRTWVVLAVVAVVALGASGALAGGLLGAFRPSSSPGPVASSPGPSTPPVASPSPSSSPSPSPSATPSATPSPSPTPTAVPTQASLPGDVVVQPGDSLSRIADRMGFRLCVVEMANPQLGAFGGRLFTQIYPGDVVHRPVLYPRGMSLPAPLGTACTDPTLPVLVVSSGGVAITAIQQEFGELPGPDGPRSGDASPVPLLEITVPPGAELSLHLDYAAGPPRSLHAYYREEPAIPQEAVTVDLIGMTFTAPAGPGRYEYGVGANYVQYGPRAGISFTFSIRVAE